MQTPYYRILAALTVLTITASSAHAYALQSKAGENISFVTGGIGDEEREAMQAIKKDYNFSMMSAQESGAYVGDTQVKISDRNGNPVINTNAGPLFYAQLPPGNYTVEARSQGQIRRQNITISENRPVNINFAWENLG